MMYYWTQCQVYALHLCHIVSLPLCPSKQDLDVLNVSTSPAVDHKNRQSTPQHTVVHYHLLLLPKPVRLGYAKSL